MPSATNFFLPELNASDDLRFRAAARTGCQITPLVDGIAAFSAMEIAIASATSTVHLSLWIFNPTTPLQARAEVNSRLRKRGVRSAVGTWGELLAIVAGLGVHVRVILSDFDPILSNLNHASNWAAYFRLRAVAARFGKGNLLEAMVSMHDARTAAFVDLFLPSKLDGLLGKINRGGISAALARVATMPRLWQLITINPSRSALIPVTSPTFTVFPATHHQKMCVIDRTVGFCGGLDVNKGRIASPAHDTVAWHDADVQLDAQVADDLDRNFVSRWNHEGPLFNSFIGGLKDPSGVTLAAKPISVPVARGATTIETGRGPATAQLWRTLSQNGLGRVPTSLVTDVRDGHRQAIASAEKFIYIENQYIRDGRLADWLIARKADKPELVVIMVLPVAPEEVAASGGADPVTLLGLKLQHDLLTRLIKEFGPNLGLFSLATRKQASQTHATNVAGSLQIYVHNKSMIVDDLWCATGSANINPRSFEVDTEAQIAWYDPVGVRAYRLKLWRELLGAPAGIATWTSDTYLSHWNEVAAENAKLTTGKAIAGRKGFVVPHDPNRFPGSGSLVIPDEFAELVDNVPESEFTT